MIYMYTYISNTKIYKHIHIFQRQKIYKHIPGALLVLFPPNDAVRLIIVRFLNVGVFKFGGGVINGGLLFNARGGLLFNARGGILLFDEGGGILLFDEGTGDGGLLLAALLIITGTELLFFLRLSCMYTFIIYVY